MSQILEALACDVHLDRAAVVGTHASLTYRALGAEVEAFAQLLRERRVRRLALYADNGPAWVIADLACLRAEITLVPLPGFFTAAQISHVLRAAAVDHVLLPEPARASMGITDGTCFAVQLANEPFDCVALAAPLAGDCAKITFTSGTTGQPKGVRLTAETLEAVAVSLAQSLRPLDLCKHMAVLPLATLLENLAGVYVPLLLGATVRLPPLSELGYSGASGLNLSSLIASIRRHRPESLILVPQLLQALVAAAEAGVAPAGMLRFVAVGGGRVSPSLHQRARACGLPVFEGYGLSECASVVTLNLPDAERAGSAGRALPHARLEIAADGEILVHGSHYLGYVGEAEIDARAPIATGDLGYVGDDGFLHVTGRKKNLFITAFGRNVSPEWIEAELVAEPAIAQAAAFGEAQPWNVAIIVSPADDNAINQAVQRANGRLPDYARIRHWLRAGTPFATANGQLTANGRLRRTALWEAYRTPLLNFYHQR